MRYIANDGTIFDDIKDCVAYERDINIKKYHEKWVDPYLNVRADKAIEIFKQECRLGRVDDDCLALEGCQTRYENISDTVKTNNGIVYLRDDLVDILIMRIRELEGKPIYNIRNA